MIDVTKLPDLLVVCFEVFIVWTFQRNWFLPKPIKIWKVWMSYLALGITTGAFSLLYPNMLLLPIITYVGILCVSYFLYQGNPLSHAFASFVLLTIGVASEAIVSSVYSGILSIDLSHIRDDDFDRAIVMLISKMLCLLIVGAVTYYARKHKSLHLRTMWKTIPLLLCQLTLIAIIIATFYNAFQNNGMLGALDVIKIVCILLVSIFIYTYYDVMTRADELKQMNQLSKIQLDNHVKHYHYVQEQEEILRSIEHDCCKFLSVIDDLIKTGHLKEAVEYKVSFEEFLNKNANLIFSPHPGVNAIVNNYLRKAKSIGVLTQCDIKVPHKLKISDIDLTIIIGNVLENAIEALENVAVSFEKELRIRLIQYDYYLFLEVVNTCCSDNQLKKPKRIRQHYGLKNVNNCVAKYSGKISTTHEDERFITTVIMNVSSSVRE